MCIRDSIVGGAYDNLKLIRNGDGAADYQLSNVPNSNVFIQGLSFSDIDADGSADIFVCNDVGDSRKYRNDGNGGFALDQNLIDTRTAISSDNSGNYAAIWTDYDNDGDSDLYVSKCRIAVDNPRDPRRVNVLYRNDNGSYTEVAAQAGMDSGAQTWLTDFADIDNDGDMDAFIANHYDDCKLMINNGNGTFTDITVISGLQRFLSKEAEVFVIQSLFRDFNNDGYVDLMISGTEHFLFYNNGDRSFALAPELLSLIHI